VELQFLVFRKGTEGDRVQDAEENMWTFKEVTRGWRNLHNTDLHN
jgi:hypothetical protein